MLQYIFDKIIGVVLYIIFLPFRFVGSIIKKVIATTLSVIIFTIIIIFIVGYTTDFISISEMAQAIIDML